MDFLRPLIIAVIKPLQALTRNFCKYKVRLQAGKLSKIIISAGIILIILLWTFVHQQIKYDYNRTITEASKETMNLAISFEEHVRKIISDADNDLIRLKQVIDTDGISSPSIAYLLDTGNNTARNQVAVYDERGFLVSSFIKNLPYSNYRDRAYFNFHRDNDNNTLFIGPSIKLKASGEITIPLSRRINKADGSFGGIVYIGLKADYFLSFFQKVNLGKNQLISLIGKDGIVRARQAGNTFDAGTNSINCPLFINSQVSTSGELIEKASPDNIERIESYRVMPDYPLIFVIGKSTKVALADFETRKQNYIFGTSLVTLFILLSCYSLVRQIEQQRKIAKELSRLDRLNLVGEIAASIGHEIRNPMTTVRGYLQIFQKKDKFTDYQQQLNTMIDELDRANAIITEFLSLAKNKTIEQKIGNLNTTIHTLYPLLQASAFQLGHDIQLKLGDIPPFSYDDKEIRQLLLNLAQNGMEAMIKGGILTIKTYLEQDNVVLAIQDTGTGIPEEILKDIGTPFKTTKETGTGLGLSVCYRIAERHKAKIEVDSSSQGTTVFVLFPQNFVIC